MLSDVEDIRYIFELTKDDPQRKGLDALKDIRLKAMDGYFENKTGIVLE